MAADGSVVLDVDMNVSDAEKELARLRKRVFKLEGEVGEKTNYSDILKERFREAEREFDALNKKKNSFDTMFFSPEEERRMDELGKTMKKLDAEIKKIDKAIDDGNISLEFTKLRYGEILQEAERLKQTEESRASEGDISSAEQAKSRIESIIQRMKSTALEGANSLKLGFIGIAEGINRLAVKGFKSAATTMKSGMKKLVSLVQKASKSFLSLFKNSNKANNSFVSGIKKMLLYSVGIRGLYALMNKLRTALTDGMKNLAQFSDSTNSSVSMMKSALTQLKNSIATAFAPILTVAAPLITQFINMMSSAANAVARLTAMLTGQKSYAKAIAVQEDYAASLEGTASAADEAAGSLAGFDEINTITTENAVSGGGAGAGEVSPSEMFETVEVEPLSFDSWGEAFSAMLSSILDVGIPKLKEGLTSLAGWINGFSANLYEMFTFPEVYDKVVAIGTELANALNGFVNMIDWATLGGALGAGLNLALGFLVSFLYTFNWLNFGTKLAEMVNNAVAEIDWENVGKLLWAKFKIALETLAGFILGLDMPELAKSASEIVMGFFNSMTETLNNIDWEGIGEQVRTFLTGIDWLGIMKSVSEAISSALSSSSDFFTGVLGEEVKEQIRDILVTVSKATLALGAILALSGINIPLGLSLLEIGAATLAATAVLDWGYISSNIQKILGEILAIAGGALLGLGLLLCLTGVNLPLGIALVAAGAAGLVTAAALNWNAIKDALSNMWSGIKSWWGSSNGPGRFLTLDYWKDLGKNMIDGLLAGLKGIFSGLASWASNVWSTITGVFSGNNAKASISGSTSGVSAVIGRSSVQMAAIPQISTAQIPRLAQGAVIPPNREFMAVLGDQRSGNNLEAPEGLIRKIVREEVAGAIGSSSNNRPIEVKVMLDKKVLARAMVNEVNSMTVQAGRPVLLI